MQICCVISRIHSREREFGSKFVDKIGNKYSEQCQTKRLTLGSALRMDPNVDCLVCGDAGV